jgi:hypothetical protein
MLSLNSNEERILRALCMRPCSVRDFTEGTSVLQVAPRYVYVYFGRLEKAGMIYGKGDQFYATTAGRDRIAVRDEALASHEARTPPAGNYYGPTWNIRAGGEQHKQFASRGIDAGRAAA